MMLSRLLLYQGEPEAARQLLDGYRALITEAMEADRFDEADAAQGLPKAVAAASRSVAASRADISVMPALSRFGMSPATWSEQAAAWRIRSSS